MRETLKGGKVIYELFTGSTTHNKCNTSALSQSAFLQGAYIKYILSVPFNLECVHRGVTVSKFTIIDLMSRCIFTRCLQMGDKIVPCNLQCPREEAYIPHYEPSRYQYVHIHMVFMERTFNCALHLSFFEPLSTR